jgi:hypothetical protein
MVNLAKKQSINIKGYNESNYFYNRPMHEQSHHAYRYNNDIHRRTQRKIVLVTEKQLFEGLVGGVCFAITSILLFKSGLTAKAFKRVNYDWLEVKVIFGIVVGWIFVWSVRKMSNVLYDHYVTVNGRKNPYEIAI